MSSDVFASIASKRPELEPLVAELQAVLAVQIVGVPLRVKRIADLLDTENEEIKQVLDLLVPELLEVAELRVCASCDDVVQEMDDDEQVSCDVCGTDLEDEEIENCYLLKQPLAVPGAGVLRAEVRGPMNSNPLNDGQAAGLASIDHWREARTVDYFLEIAALGDEEQQRILETLQRWGVCQIRWTAMTPDHARLRSLADGVGPAMTRQNDFEGDIKVIAPKHDVRANTGDSAQELGFHVDGTQHEKTPAILVFQYEVRPAHGGYSTFLDMASVFAEFDPERLEYVLTKLARRDCARFEKKGMTFEGPVIQSVHSGRAISCRLRFDGENERVCTVHPECQDALAAVQEAVASRTEVLEIKPREGDIIMFDNWRVLHGRRAVGGRYQRLHDRMWIADLHTKLQPTYSLGVRPLGAALMASIQRANATPP